MFRDTFLDRIQIKGTYYIYFYSILVGVLSGAATIVFVFLLHSAERFVFTLHQRSYDDNHTIIEKIQLLADQPGKIALLVLLPALGAFLSGVITHYWADGRGGTGADAMIKSFHRKEGRIKKHIPFIKSLGTILTLSSGGSGGKEGPVAQIGGAIGVIVADFVKAGARARRTLLLAGTAAGLGAVFKAPLGGALTAVEMVYKEDIEADALVPCFLSSVTAYLVYSMYAGTGNFMNIGVKVSFSHTWELLFYLLLGVFCFVFGFLLIKGFNDTRVIFGRKLKVHPLLKPAIGGLMVGGISLLFFEVTGGGTSFLAQTFSGASPNFFGVESQYVVAISFLLIAFMKIVSTTLTIGSGGSAGIFGPSLFIGGMLGAAVGTIAQILLPDVDISIGSYIFVGMGGFYAGVANAPLAGIIMISEMTGTYVLLVPLIIVSIFTFILSKKITYYKSQVENRFSSPAHHYDMRIDVIESIVIKSAFHEYSNLAVVSNTMLLRDLRARAFDLQASDFVVVDDHHNYFGVLSLRHLDMRNLPWSDENHTISAHVDCNVPTITHNGSLGDALQVILECDIDKIAIVTKGKVEGYVSVKDIFNCYLSIVKSKKHHPVK